MHVVFDARTATPHFPGISRYVRHLVPGIVDQMGSADALTVLHHPAAPLSLPANANINYCPVDKSPFSVAQQWRIPSLLKQLQADIYHTPYYLMPHNPGVKTVLTIHDLIPQLLPDYSTRKARLLFNWATRRAVRAADYVIAVSHSTAIDLKHAFPDVGDRVEVIHHGIESSFMPRERVLDSGLCAQYEVPNEYILFVGSDRPHKNVAGLLKAYASLREMGDALPLVLLTPTGHVSEQTQRLIDDLGLARQVYITGAVAEDELSAFYSAARVFALPSLYEGFGFPVLEAMACGTPVVCSRISSLPEVAGNAAVFVDPNDTLDIARSILTLLHDKGKWLQCSEASLGQARLFDWAKTARQTWAVYEQALLV
ncbi:MAG: glycosyltransferase family 1 protein [Spartobacteria bacterium]|nr:glycosyltransferase family 1 protein [Spartobacteria bacterium]